MITKVTATWQRQFSNGQQSFSRLLVRFDNYKYHSWPLLNYLWHDMPNSPDGWPIGFEDSKKRQGILAQHRERSSEVKFFHCAELEADVPTEYLSAAIGLVRAAGQKYLLHAPEPLVK